VLVEAGDIPGGGIDTRIHTGHHVVRSPSFYRKTCVSQLFNFVDATTLFNMLGAFGALMILDVRSPAAYAKGHLPGSLHVPILESDIEEIRAQENFLATNRALSPIADDDTESDVTSRTTNPLYTSGQSGSRSASPPASAITSPFEKPTILEHGMACVESRCTPNDARRLRRRNLLKIVIVGDAVEPDSGRLCRELVLADMLQQEGRVMCVIMIRGGIDSFTSKYPFVLCPLPPSDNIPLQLESHVHSVPFLWYPSEILHNSVFLGNSIDARHTHHLSDLNITVLVDCTPAKSTVATNAEEFDEQDSDSDDNSNDDSTGILPSSRQLRSSEEKCDSSPPSASANTHSQSRQVLDVDLAAALSEGIDTVETLLLSTIATLQKHVTDGTCILVYAEDGSGFAAALVLVFVMHHTRVSLKQAFDRVLSSRRKPLHLSVELWKLLDRFEREHMHKSTINSCVDLIALQHSTGSSNASNDTIE
jgi:rhodanese-related sulfurtransferase